MLLVLDNFEHLLEGVEIIGKILQETSGIRILVTSRERLNLQSETVIMVSGMDLPSEEGVVKKGRADAVTLFLQNASRVLPAFKPTEDEINQINRICCYVGGMPLAIELAAAWLHVLTLDEIYSELETNLDLLTSDIRDVPERHRSIRLIFDHSWSMLDPGEQVVFTRLSLFRGGFTKDAARDVVNASLQQLSGLVNKSFLSQDSATGRLEMHELLRSFAQEKLEENPAEFQGARLAHGTYFADFMEEGWELLRGPLQSEILEKIEADLENVRFAWEFFLEEKNVTMLWKFVYSLWYVYWIRWWNLPGMTIFQEASQVLEGSSGKDTRILKAMVQSLQSYFMAWLMFSEEGYEIAVECAETMEEFEHQPGLIFALYSQTVNSYFNHNYLEMLEISQRILRIAEGMGDPWLLAFALFAAGLTSITNERYAQAQVYAERNLAIYEEIGDAVGITTPLIVLGHASFALGELDQAREYYQRCLDISLKSQFYYSIQTASKYLTKVALAQGYLEEAEEHLQQSLGITNQIGFVRDIINLIYEYSRLFAARGEVHQAINLLGLVIEHPVSDRYRMIDGRIRDSAVELLEKLEGDLPENDFLEALEQGRLLDLDEVTVQLLEDQKVDRGIDVS
jgi:tetratricopeptide (TPR) repeat protein